MDLDREEVRLHDGRGWRLTTKEGAALAYLAERPGRVVGREELQVEVWGYAPGIVTRAVDNTIRRLRTKIEPDPADPQHLRTVHGEGYRLVLPVPVGRPAGQPAPGSPTSFHGRQRELAQLREALAQASWVSLVGPGGVGKTRLARELLRERGGVFVDLRGARTDDDVRAVLAATLEVPSDGVERALRHADASRRLVVLDNCEQVLAPAAQWAVRLTEAVAALRVVLTTRREPDLDGQGVLSVPCLDLDDAASLLAARAAEAAVPVPAPRWRARLAERLEGLPLAVELAAARLGVMGPPDLLERLDRALDVLARADDPTHHRTLRATVAWSWSLLSPEAQRTLARCTVFRGGFTAAAAAAVVADDPDGSETSVLDVLDHLRRSSLLQARTDRGGRIRLSLLEAIRQFAAEHVSDAAALADRHAAWAASLPAWQCRVEHDNLVGAFAASRAAPPARRLALAERLARGFRAHGPPERWLSLTAALARDPGLTPDEAAHARLLWFDARHATGHDVDPGELDAIEGELAGRGAPDRVASLERARGRTLRAGGDLDAADAAYRRGLEAAADPWLRGRLRFDLGTLAADRQRHDEAVHHYEAAHEAFAELGDADLASRAELHVAMLQSEQGRLDVARRRSERVLDYVVRVADTRGEGVVRDHLALIALEAGDLHEAAEHLEAALGCHRAVGDRRFEAYNHLLQATLAHHRGDVALAHACAERAVREFEAVGDRTFGALARARLGVTEALQGHVDAARDQLARAARELASGSRDFRRGVEVLGGFVDLAEGRRAEARARLRDDLAQATSSFVRMAAQVLDRASR